MGVSLSEKVLLCSLKLSLWRAVITDKNVTKETNDRYQAIQTAGTYRKRLMHEQLKDVNSAFRDVSEFHKEHTLPWSIGKSEGILLVEHYQEYRDGLAEKIQVALDKVEEFIRSYTDHVYQAEQDLGEMFNPMEYPQASEIRNYFKIESNAYPIPDPKDWRIALSDEEVEELRAKFEANMQAKLNSSMENLWQRVYEPIKKMAETLSQEDKIFKKSLVDNIIDIVRLLPALNIANDPRLEALRREIEQRLCSHSPEILRTNNHARQDTATAAREIAAKMSVFVAPVENDTEKWAA